MFDYLLYRVGQFLALHLPLGFSYKVAELISDVRLFFSPEDRFEVSENLKVIFPENSKAQINHIRTVLFRNFAKYLVDFVRFEKIDKAYVKKNIRLKNSHYLDQELSKGKGVIIVSAHLGNWELGAAVVGQLGYPIWAVARSHTDKQVNNFFQLQRENKGVRVIPLEHAARQCLNVLKQNKILALVGDREFSKTGGIVVDFLGKPTLLPEGPAALALKTGAPILPTFMYRNPDDTFTLSFEEPICINAGDDKTNRVQLILRYNKVIEKYIRTLPEQWHVFKRFWVIK